MSGFAMGTVATNWMWSVLDCMVNVYDGATTLVSTHGPPLVQGAKEMGLKGVEKIGGTGMYLGNVAIRAGGQLALGGLAVGAVAAGTAVGALNVAVGATAGNLVGGVPGGIVGGALGAIQGTQAIETGIDVAEDILDLSADVSRMTIVGRLPNRPGFADAVADKGAALHAQYQQVLATETAGSPVHTALTALDGALASSAAPTQGGNPTALPAQDFHAALALGGHFVKPDGGTLYNTLSAIPGMQARTSSHYKGQAAQQFGMDLPGGLGHLLIGQTSNGDTFFQLESHGLGNPSQSKVEKLLEGIGHTMAYLQHIGGSTQYVQIGPGGCIAASEKDGQEVVLA